MHEGVFVLLLDQAEAEDGVGIAEHGFRHLLHHGAHGGDLHLFAQAGIFQHVAHQLARPGFDLGGLDQLLLKRLRPGRFLIVVVQGQQLGFQRGLHLRLGGGSAHVVPLVGVDVEFLEAVTDDLGHFLPGADQPRRDQKPGPLAVAAGIGPIVIEIMHEHAGFELLDGDFLDHEILGHGPFPGRTEVHYGATSG
nr:uncharacterized protein [uncultured bacterium]